MEAAEWIKCSEILLSATAPKPVSLLTSEMTSQLQIPSAEHEKIVEEKQSAVTKNIVLE